jgi:hypothetical protein
MFTIDVQKGSKTKFGGLLPSEIRKEVFDYQMAEYGHSSVEELRQKIEQGKLKMEFSTGTASMITDDPDVISKDLNDWHDVQLFTEMYVGSNK